MFGLLGCLCCDPEQFLVMRQVLVISYRRLLLHESAAAVLTTIFNMRFYVLCDFEVNAETCGFSQNLALGQGEQYYTLHLSLV